MSDIKIFRIGLKAVSELSGESVGLEKSLQNLIEKNLETFLGVRFLATEYSTGKTHAGRIDTLGIDENRRPVIIEYKRTLNENVINQGLFYLDWLMDHKAEFVLKVIDKFGKAEADLIEWSNPRLICIAGDFTKYDEHAVQQMNRNIELIRYRKFETDLLLFELVNAVSIEASKETVKSPNKRKSEVQHKTVTDNIAVANVQLRDRFDALQSFLLALGDDVQIVTNKYYLAFKRIKNFACVELYPKIGRIIVYVKIDPTSIELREGFTRDVRSIGHYGTGDLEINIFDDHSLENAKPLIIKSYEAS